MAFSIEASATIPSMTTAGLTGIDSRDIVIPRITSEGFTGIFTDISISMQTVIITGSDSIVHIESIITLPSTTAEMVEAENISGSFSIPMIATEIVERETVLGSANVPMITAELASGDYTNSDISVPIMSAAGLFSGQCEITSPMTTVEIVVTIGGVTDVNISLPIMTVEMEGKAEHLINCSVSVPSIYVNGELATGKIIAGDITIPIVQVTLSSYENITGDIEASIAMFETYILGAVDGTSCTVFRYDDLPDILVRPVIEISMIEVSITEI